jgi:hypothetical protein
MINNLFLMLCQVCIKFTKENLCKLLKRPGKLVRATRPAAFAIDTAEPCYGVLDLHPRTKRSHALGIAVASSGEGNPADDTVGDFDVYLSGTDQTAGLERGGAHASLGGVADLYNIKNIHCHSSIKSAFASGVI